MKTLVKIVLAILLFGFIRHNIDLFPLTSLIVFILCYIGIGKMIGDWKMSYLKIIIVCFISSCMTFLITRHTTRNTPVKTIYASETLADKPKLNSRNYTSEFYHNCITSHEFSFLNPANCQRSSIFTILYRGHSYIVLSDAKRPSAICHDLECPCLKTNGDWKNGFDETWTEEIWTHLSLCRYNWLSKVK